MKKVEHVKKELEEIEEQVSTWTSADGGLTAAAADLTWQIARARKDIELIPAPHEGISDEYWRAVWHSDSGVEGELYLLMSSYYSEL